MVRWESFIDALGTPESSFEFTGLCQSIGEAPHISSDPDEYNDSVGKTKYYKFYKAGVEVGFREGLLNHIHFYFFEEEGYSPFRGCFKLGIEGGTSRNKLVQLFGMPSASGEGKTDMLIGYMNGWSKYEEEKYSLHLQFNEYDDLCRATLINNQAPPVIG